MPDITKGFTRFPNELLEAILNADLTAPELKVLLAVIRKTYGYQRECEFFSVSLVCKLINRSQSVVSRAISGLVNRKIIIEVASPDFSNARALAVNEELWEWETKKATPPKNGIQTPLRNGIQTPLGNGTPTYCIKEKYKRNYKDNNMRTKSTPPSYDKELFMAMLNQDD